MAANEGPAEARTSIDSLAELLRQRGKMELSKIASTLGVDQSIVESWAKVLEEGNLARIVYEVGKMYVEPMTITKEQEQAVKSTIETEEAAIASSMSIQTNILSKLTDQLNLLSTSVVAADATFKARLPDLEKRLETINKIYTTLEGEASRIDVLKKNAEASYTDLNKKTEVLYGKIEGFDTGTTNTAAQEIAKLDTALKRANELESQFDMLTSSKDKAMDSIRRSLSVQTKALDKELHKAEQAINEQLKTYAQEISDSTTKIKEQVRGAKNLSGEISAFAREREAAKKRLSDTKATFGDEYVKAYDRMRSGETVLRAEIKGMLEQLDTLKASFGEAARIFDSLHKAKDDIDALSAKIAALQEEATRIEEQISALQAAKGSTERKVKMAAEVKAKAERLAADTKQAKKKVDDINNDMSERLSGTRPEGEQGSE